MLHTRVDAICSDKHSEPGQETVGIQDPVGTQCIVLHNDMQYAFATALPDQLEDYGTNVKEHCRRLRNTKLPAKPQIEAKPSLEIQRVSFWHMFHPSKFNITTTIDNYLILTHTRHAECI